MISHDIRDSSSHLPESCHVLQIKSIVNRSSVSFTVETKHFSKDFDQWSSCLFAKETVAVILILTAVQRSGDLGFKPLDFVLFE